MSRISVLAVLALGVAAGGCATYRALDQAAADLAAKAPDCKYEPVIGPGDNGGKTCTVSFTIRSKTARTVTEPGKPPVTTQIIATPSATTTQTGPTP